MKALTSTGVFITAHSRAAETHSRAIEKHRKWQGNFRSGKGHPSAGACAEVQVLGLYPQWLMHSFSGDVKGPLAETRTSSIDTRQSNPGLHCKWSEAKSSHYLMAISQAPRTKTGRIQSLRSCTLSKTGSTDCCMAAARAMASCMAMQCDCSRGSVPQCQDVWMRRQLLQRETAGATWKPIPWDPLKTSLATGLRPLPSH